MSKKKPAKKKKAKKTRARKKFLQKRKEQPRRYEYDLYKDGITQSALKCFLQCPETFYQCYIEGWTRKGEVSKPLAFGSAFHDVLAEYGPEVASIVLDRHFRKNPRQDLGEQEFMQGQIEVLHAAYEKYWQKDNMGIDWVSREEVFHVTLEGCGDIPLTGRWDGMYKDSDKKPGLFETKTKGRIDAEGIQKSIPLDLQIMFYLTTAEESQGMPFSEVTYNLVRQPQIKPRVKDTLQDYLTRLADDVASRPEFYFMRWRLPIMPGDIKRFVDRTLRPAIKSLWNWWDHFTHCKDRWDNPYHYFNPASLFYGQNRSEMFDFHTTGNTFLYKRKPCPFVELED